MNTLDHYKQAFNSVGWFIPPYVTISEGFSAGFPLRLV